MTQLAEKVADDEANLLLLFLESGGPGSFGISWEGFVKTQTSQLMPYVFTHADTCTFVMYEVSTRFLL